MVLQVTKNGTNYCVYGAGMDMELSDVSYWHYVHGAGWSPTGKKFQVHNPNQYSGKWGVLRKAVTELSYGSV